MPKARALFERVHGDDLHSHEFEAHMARVMGGLDMAISLLDEPEVLKSYLAHLNEQHVNRNIDNSYYDVSEQKS